MAGLRKDSSAGGPRYRVSYVKRSEMEDGRPCQVYCAEDDPDAIEAVVELTGMQYQEWRFGRASYDATRWDGGLDKLLRAFAVAFEQGVGHQKLLIRNTLREVIGV